MKIIGVVAGKGGVGKSTVAVGLARFFQKKGCKVGVMDADIYGPSVRQMLPEDVLPSQVGDKVSPAQSGGIKLISVAYFRQGHSASIVRSPIANGIIKQFINEVTWGDLDYLIVDFPPGTGDIQLTLMQEMEFSGALVVTTPQEVSIIDVRKAVEMLIRMNIEVLGVIENMSYYVDPSTGGRLHLFGEGGGRRLCEEMGLPFLGELVIDPALCKCADLGRCPSEFDPKAPSVQFFKMLVDKLERKEVIKSEGVSLSDDGKRIVVANKEIAASALQRGCPCIRCQTGEKVVDNEVFVKDIEGVGRYGIKLFFSSGCNRGIYTFSYLGQFA